MQPANESTPGPYQPGNSPQMPGFVDYLSAIVKRRRLIVGITFAVAVLTAVRTLFMPNIYTAKTMILPAQEDRGLATAMLTQLGSLAGLTGGAIGGKSLEGLYVTILQSEAIKDPVIDRYGLMRRFKKKFRSDVYKRLDANVKVSTGKRDGVITISVSDRDPRWAAALADAYVRELGNLTVRLNVTGAGKNRRFYENRLAEARADLARAEEALKAFQSKNKALNVPEQARATIEGVAQLRAQMALQEVRLATLQRQFTDASQEVKTAKTSIANLKAQIDQLEGQGGGAIPSLGSVPNLGQEYVRLMREFKVQESIVEILTKQYELAKINESKDVEPFQVIQSAKVPERKSKPKRSVKVIFAAMTAFFITLVYAVSREYADRLPEKDKARWREISEMSGLRSFNEKLASIRTLFIKRFLKKGIQDCTRNET